MGDFKSPILFMGTNHLPSHVAIIMDGNGRWAKEHHLTRSQGHLEGVKRVQEIISEACKCGIKVLTLYAFSTENWNRPQGEVSLIMQTLVKVLGQKMNALHEEDIKIQVLGRTEGVPDAVLKAFEKAMTLTSHNKKMVLNIAFNYGGRSEILDAVRHLCKDVISGQCDLKKLDEKIFSRYLYTSSEVDLLIRTSGELRVSNFLLWQISYAELYFTSKYWPEFTAMEFHKALEDFSKRDRRWGSVKTNA